MIALSKGERQKRQDEEKNVKERGGGMKPVLAILDSEEAYVSRLLRYLNSREGMGITAAAFTSEESLRRYMENRNIEMLLCEAGCYYRMEHPPDCKTVLLSGQSCVRESGGLPVIFKFQSAQEIAEEILMNYQELQAGFLKTDISRSFMACTVCSPSGGSGVSALAFAIAKKKSKNGRVFFLTLDPFYQPETPGSKNEALARAIYYIKQKSAGWKEKLNQAIVKTERIDCLYGLSHWADISECTGEEMVELVKELTDAGGYRFVVVDAGEFTDAAAGCIGISQKVIMIVGGGKQAGGKEKEFLRQACFRDSVFMEKLVRVQKGEKEQMLEQAIKGIDD